MIKQWANSLKYKEFMLNQNKVKLKNDQQAWTRTTENKEVKNLRVVSKAGSSQKKINENNETPFLSKCQRAKRLLIKRMFMRLRKYYPATT